MKPFQGTCLPINAVRAGLALAAATLLVLTVSCSKKGSGSEPVALPPPVSASASGLWSDAGTWGGTKPVDYQEVTIPAGVSVTIDENTPALGALLVNGSLVFAEQDIEVSAGRIEVRGAMTIGTETKPFTHRAVITLGGNPGDPGQGNGFQVMAGGTLDLHGEERGQGWTRLSRTAPAATATLVTLNAMAWRPGDHIVIASTDFDMNQAEEMVVSAASGTAVTLSAPLKYTHWSATESGVEERAEVGLLSRNVVVQGYAGSEADGKGGHVMAMAGSTMRISGVEFTRMGIRGTVARYPVHFHMMGDATGSYVKDSSIHHNFNRCVTIHGTHNIVVSGNVAYDTFGHCYIFEDGVETGNLLENNLGVLVRLPDPADRITDSDDRPSVFWITNPDNTIRGNAASGAAAYGFWYDLHLHPTGLSATDSIFPINTPLKEFSSNTAHSNGQTGMEVDGSKVLLFYQPRLGGSPDGAFVNANFDNVTVYKNRYRGVWYRGVYTTFTNTRVADNALGFDFAGIETYLRNAIIVGESLNTGNPGPGEVTGPDGRSLPNPQDPGYPIYGYEFYDGLVAVETTTFVNFISNNQRNSGAMSIFRFDSAELTPTNYSMAVSFVNANQVYMDSGGAGPYDGLKTAVFLDKDGSTTGTAGHAIVVNNPIMIQSACLLRPEWNSYVCPPAYGRLSVINKGAVSSDPLTVTRQENGTTLTLQGRVDNFGEYFANLLINRLYSLQFAGTTPQNLQFGLSFRQPGDWIETSVPYPFPAFKVVQNGNTANPLAAAASLAALQASTATAYFYDGTNLHLRLVIPAGVTETTVDVGP